MCTGTKVTSSRGTKSEGKGRILQEFLLNLAPPAQGHRQLRSMLEIFQDPSVLGNPRILGNSFRKTPEEPRQPQVSGGILEDLKVRQGGQENKQDITHARAVHVKGTASWKRRRPVCGEDCGVVVACQDEETVAAVVLAGAVEDGTALMLPEPTAELATVPAALFPAAAPTTLELVSSW